MSAAVDLSMNVMPAAAARNVLQQPFNDWRDMRAIQQATPLPLMPDAWAGVAAGWDAEQVLIPTPPLRAVPSTPTESVSVFVHAATVAIVVRNVSLSEEQALQCAFATAAELVGERSGLHDLILNGRAIYQQRRACDPRGHTHSGWRLTA